MQDAGNNFTADADKANNKANDKASPATSPATAAAAGGGLFYPGLFLSFDAATDSVQLVYHESVDEYGAVSVRQRMLPANGLILRPLPPAAMAGVPDNGKTGLMLANGGDEVRLNGGGFDKPVPTMIQEINAWLLQNMGQAISARQGRGQGPGPGQDAASLWQAPPAPAVPQAPAAPAAAIPAAVAASVDSPAKALISKPEFSRRKKYLLGGAVALTALIGGVMLLGDASHNATANEMEQQRRSITGVTPTTEGMAGGIANAAAPATPAVMPVASDPSSQARLTAEEKLRLQQLTGVVGNVKADKIFYVFSDPRCPHCQRLELAIEQYKKEGGAYEPIIIPVAFQRGAGPLAGATLCSTDRAAEWKKAIGGAEVGASCQDGENLLGQNMAYFDFLRLSGTPTMIIDDVLVSNAGSVTAQQLKEVLGS